MLPSSVVEFTETRQGYRSSAACVQAGSADFHRRLGRRVGNHREMLSGKGFRHLREECPHQGTYCLHLHVPIENDSLLVLLIEYRLFDGLISWVRLPNPVQKRALPLP
jgi:hypothetical protein